MTAGPLRAVFDCNTLLQALVSNKGSAHACFREAWAGRCTLSVCDYVLNELRSVADRPQIRAKFRLDQEKIDGFVNSVRIFAVKAELVPEIYEHPVDSKDSHYVNLAVATGSKLIVSRDRHLLNLMDQRIPGARDFLQRFPGVLILTPPEFLRSLRESLLE